MHNRLNSTRSILLVFGLLASGSGCHVLNIPSYRADAPNGIFGADGAGYSHAGCEYGESMGASDSAACITEGDCPPGFFPPLGGGAHGGLPVPACYAEWRAQKNLPEAAAYPRFHPLPTRPMFQPRPVSEVSQWGASLTAPTPYGQLPAAEAGSPPWNRLESTPSGGVPLSHAGLRPAPNLAPPLAHEPLPLPAEIPAQRLPR